MNAPLLLFSILPILTVATIGDRDKTIPTFCGVAAAIAALFIEREIIATFDFYRLSITAGIRAFVVFGATEEILKYLTLSVGWGLSRGGRAVVQASIFSAIGFASIENFLYMSGYWRAFGDSDAFTAHSLLRFFMPFMMHLTAGPILMSGYSIQQFRPVGGLTLAMLYHGTYDAILMLSSPFALRGAYLLIIGGFVVSALIYRNARDEGGANDD